MSSVSECEPSSALPLFRRFTTRAKTDALNRDRLRRLLVTEFVYKAHEFPGHEANGKDVDLEKMKKYLLNVMVPQDLTLKVCVGSCSHRCMHVLSAWHQGWGASDADQGANRTSMPEIYEHSSRPIEPCSRIAGKRHSRPGCGFQDCPRRHE